MAEPDFTKGASPQSPYDTLPSGLGLGPLASQIRTLQGGGVLPTGTASGDLTGSYPNPSIANGAVTNAKLAAGAVTNAKVDAAAGIVYSKLNLAASIVSADIVDGTLVNADISASAAIAYSKLALAGSITSSDIVDGTIVDADINAAAGIALSKLAGGYTTYTPTWTSTGTAPAIGDATVVARYIQVGKKVHAFGSITFGASSTFGTGNYRFALPVTASANAAHLGTCYGLDSSASNEGLFRVATVTTGTVQFVYGATYLGTSTSVGQLAPWTWAQSDVLQWNLTYEAA